MQDSWLYHPSAATSHAVNAENPSGAKGDGGKAVGKLGPSRKGSPCLRDIKSGDVVTLMDVQASGMITHIWMTVDQKTSDADRYVFRDLVLRMYWDDEVFPSVECPLGDFFCLGFGESYLIDSYFIAAAPNRGMNGFFSMPFKKRARITLENQHAQTIGHFFYQIDYLEDVLQREDTLYFHAQWRREAVTSLKKDYVVLDGVQGNGTYIGTFIGLTSLQRYWWGEGEMKFYIDGDDTYPTICGTGMEDYFGGSWSFAKQEEGRTVEQTYSYQHFGYPFYSTRDTLVHSNYHMDDTLPMRSFYRWHAKDPIFFHKDLTVTLQQIGVGHGGLFERQDDVCSVAYWYQDHPHTPFPALLDVHDRWPR